MSESILIITLQSATIYKKNYLGSFKTYVELNLGGNRTESVVSKGNTPEWNQTFNLQKTTERFILISLYDKGLFSNKLLGEGLVQLENKTLFTNNSFKISVYRYNVKIADIVFNIYIDAPLFRPQSQVFKKQPPEMLRKEPKSELNVMPVPSLILRPSTAESNNKYDKGSPEIPSKKSREIKLIANGIQLSDLVYDKMIYANQSGKQEVYLGRIKTDNTPIAIKVSYCDGNEEFNLVQREALALSQLSHPNICKVYGTLLDMTGNKLKNLIVLERCEGISLRHEIENRAKDNRFFTETEVIEFIKCLISAFAHIQSKHIVHSDIKPDNIVISARGNLKIIDFGISLHGYSDLFETTKTLKVGGTVPYFSPLQLQGYLGYIQGVNPTCLVRHNPLKSDVYSLGLSFIHLTTLNPPNGLNNLDDRLEDRILSTIYTIPYGETVKQTIKKMMAIDEHSRPDFISLNSELNFYTL